MHYSEFEDAYENGLLPENEFLSLPISRIQPRRPVLVETSASVAEAVRAMNVNHTGCVLVQQQGRLVGIFTERDVITKVFGRNDAEKVRVTSVMTPDPEALEMEDDLAFALHHMSIGGYRHIPIVQDGKPIGVLSVRDIVNYLSDQDPEGIMNLPPTPGSAIYRTVEGG